MYACNRRVSHSDAHWREEADTSCDALAREIKEMSAAIRRARGAAASVRRQWVLTAPMERTTIAIYTLARYSAEPCIVYLERCARERHWPSRGREDLQMYVEDLFMGTDSAIVAAMTDHDDPLDEASLTLAWKYVHEWSVVCRVRDLNVRLGIALPTRLLLDYAERIRNEIPESMRPLPKGICGERRAEKWARLLRRRWGGRHAAVPTQEPMESSELDAKVARISFILSGDWPTFSYDWLRIRSREMGSPGVPSSGTDNCMVIAKVC